MNPHTVVSIPGDGIGPEVTQAVQRLLALNYLADHRKDESCRQVATRIRQAYDRAVADGAKTRDLGGDLGTEAFADAVIERLGSG